MVKNVYRPTYPDSKSHILLKSISGAKTKYVNSYHVPLADLASVVIYIHGDTKNFR